MDGVCSLSTRKHIAILGGFCNSPEHSGNVYDTSFALYDTGGAVTEWLTCWFMDL